MKPTAVLLSIALCASCIPSPALSYRVLGRVYEIAERDLIKDVKRRVAEIDWSKVFGEEQLTQKVRDYRPPDLKKLPRAIVDRVKAVDPSWVLDQDIVIPTTGQVLFEAGTIVNPLKNKALTIAYAVIDGSMPSQVSWLANSGLLENPRIRVVITDGSYWEVAKALGKPVFYLPEAMASRMHLTCVPSVVYQKDEMLEVREYYVPTIGQKND